MKDLNERITDCEDLLHKKPTPLGAANDEWHAVQE
jgi:hypothetical protein